MNLVIITQCFGKKNLIWRRKAKRNFGEDDVT